MRPSSLMPGFLMLHVRRLLAHPVRLLLSIAGIMAGTALIVSILGVYGSITHSVDRLVAVAGDADLEVSPASDTGFGEELLAAVAAVDGVAHVAPLVRADVAIDREVVVLVGADARAAAFGSTAMAEAMTGASADATTGATPEGGVVLPRRLSDRLRVRSGDDVQVYSSATGTSRPTAVAAVIDSPTLGSVNGGRLAFATLGQAQELVGRGEVIDSVLVRTEPGASAELVGDRLADRLGARVLIETRDERAERIAAPAITYLSQIGPVSGMALVVGGFLVFNTINMAAMERRRELATMRALGASRSRVIGGLVGEASVIGVVGALGGAASGIPLARRIVEELPAALELAIGVDVSYDLPVAFLAAAVVIGTATAATAALLPALRVSRSHPLESLRPAGTLATGGEPAGVAWRPLGAGVALTAGGIAVLLSVRDDRATAGVLLVALGAVAASYGLAGLITRFAARVARLGGGLGHVASSGLERSPHRVWATAMAVALAVAMTVAVAAGARNQLDVDTAHLRNLRDVDLWVASRPLDQLPVDVYLPGEWPEVLAGLDGVASTSALTVQEAVRDNRNFLVYGIDAPAGAVAFPMVDLASSSARARMLAGEGAIVTRQYARTFGLHTGDTAVIHGARDTVRLPVLDVVHTLSVSDNGMVAMTDAHLRRAFGTTGYSTIDLRLTDGASAATVRADVEALAADQPFPVAVGTGEEGYQAIIGGIVAVTRLLYGVLFVTTAIAGLAVLNTLVASILDRWRELGVLRAVGTTPRQLAGIIGLEALGVGAAGAVVGASIGELIHWAGVRYVGSASPLPAEFAFAPELTLIAAGAGVAATLLGALLPVWRAAHVDVLDAISWE